MNKKINDKIYPNELTEEQIKKLSNLLKMYWKNKRKLL